MDSEHWNKVYSTKNSDEVSWFQEVPHKSLELIKELNLRSSDPIIDIGGGDSKLPDHLVTLGFKDISVLDISAAAIDKLRARLADKDKKVSFIVSDVTKFNAPKKYKLWHDRATFHFLTDIQDIEAYLKIAYDAVEEGGDVIVSTFSKSGPLKCSGLPITQYSDADLKALFGKYFTSTKCVEDSHTTPWGSVQDFVYCAFKKISKP